MKNKLSKPRRLARLSAVTVTWWTRRRRRALLAVLVAGLLAVLVASLAYAASERTLLDPSGYAQAELAPTSSSSGTSVLSQSASSPTAGDDTTQKAAAPGAAQTSSLSTHSAQTDAHTGATGDATKDSVTKATPPLRGTPDYSGSGSDQTATVTDWTDFQTAYENVNVSKIILAPTDTTSNTIGRDDSTASTMLSDTYELARSLEVTSEDANNPVTLDFGDSNPADSHNSFHLDTATADVSYTLNLNNLKIAHDGSGYNGESAVIYDNDSTDNSAGWTVSLNNVYSTAGSSGASTSPSTSPAPLIACGTNLDDFAMTDGVGDTNGVKLDLAGTVDWFSSYDNQIVTAGSTTIASDANVDITGTGGDDIDGCICNLNSVSCGEGASFDVQCSGISSFGGSTMVALVTTGASFGADDIIKILDTPYGIRTPATMAGDVDFSANDQVTIENKLGDNTTSAITYAIYVGQGSVSFAASDKLTDSPNISITSTSTSGMGIITAPTADNAAPKVTIGAYNNVNIAVATTAIYAADVTFGANCKATINASKGVTECSTSETPTNANAAGATAAIKVVPYEASDTINNGTLSVENGADVTVTTGGVNGVLVDACIQTSSGGTNAGTGGLGTLQVQGGSLDVEAPVTSSASYAGLRYFVVYIASTASSASSGGGLAVTVGGKFIAKNTGSGNDCPALRMTLGYGRFLIDGQGSEVDISQADAQTTYQAALHFAYGTNVQLTIENSAKLSVTRDLSTDGTAVPAIRFGVSKGDGMTIESGGQVYVNNAGNSNPGDDDGTDAQGNEAVEFANSTSTNVGDFSFTVKGSDPSTGQASSCVLLADYGPAINAHAQPDGSITVGEGCVFEATGNDPDGIFYATGTGFSFSSYKPQYYDFKNTYSTEKAPVFYTGGGCTFTSCESDTSIWLKGSDVDGDASKNFTDITWQVTGDLNSTSFASGTSNAPVTTGSFTDPISSTTYSGSDSAFASWYQTTSTTMGNYIRISGNNSSPTVTAAPTATNADHYLRFPLSVPEGVNVDWSRATRAAEAGEVLGEYSYAPDGDDSAVNAEGNSASNTQYTYSYGTVVGATTYYAPSIEDDPYYSYADNTAETAPSDLRISPSGGTAGTDYLKAGDQYSLGEAWRDADSPDSTNAKLADLTGLSAVTVYDVLPPNPLTISTVHAGDDTISGTWSQDSVKDGGDKPAYLYYELNTTSGTGTLTLATNVTIDAADNSGSGKWSFKAPADMAQGDTLQVFAADNGAQVGANQGSSLPAVSGLQIYVDKTSGALESAGTSGGTYVNLEPATTTTYHDANIPAATSTTVQKEISVLSLSGGDALIKFGSLDLAQAVPNKNGSPICIKSNLANGYNLQVTSSTTSGQLSLGGQADLSTPGSQIPWGDATSSQASFWHVMMSSDSSANPYSNTPAGSVADPFKGLSDTSSPGPTSSAATVISADAGTVSVAGGDYFLPTYGLALYGGLQSGTYATTLTYTLSPNIANP
ncbi:MAG: hypothetical protein LBL67_06500 [Coriobacteriales bacterium]|jgi:hypothetical protein|nr:hypothetical protein [Coriobacteriales bacterium]